MSAQTRAENANQILWFGDNLMTIRVPASAGDDQISVIECRMPQGETTPLHITLSGDEVIHMLEGTMQFFVDGKDFPVHVGQTVMAPKGLPHNFRIESTDAATCLIVTQGAEFEQMVRQMSMPAPTDSLPPRAERTPETTQRFFDTCAQHNIEVVGAPLR
ncbi:quercetin dioxygenase-like cupin family protein [Aminobacter aminovorans]|uniref:DNA-binding transcriptional repressor PuuR n=1 Tax=Aminobacter aminovorans TaxID=83263 RepID=A0A380WNP1_AMIAI|nr:cupin domain-containing protein [Aminobacter aminovorans]TCS29754.1 quercetin dioxygenase-like cupin family protein [Aminobacter aminovorans]SUU90603.1 DNA-binding transcriptional repressor PuuR [Aminobacter aminovorans]